LDVAGSAGGDQQSQLVKRRGVHHVGCSARLPDEGGTQAKMTTQEARKKTMDFKSYTPEDRSDSSFFQILLCFAN
jgi:hypothetical protein